MNVKYSPKIGLIFSSLNEAPQEIKQDKPEPLLAAVTQKYQLLHNKNSLDYDQNFNLKSKALFESKLSALVMKYGLHLFMPVMVKMNALIIPDIKKCFEHNDIASRSLRDKLSTNQNLISLTNGPKGNHAQSLIEILQSKRTQDFELAMDIQYCWITAFTKGGTKKPHYDRSIATGWCTVVNLETFWDDMLYFRDGFFEDYTRVKKSPWAYSNSKECYGILDEPSELGLNTQEKDLLFTYSTIYKPGLHQFRITTKGSFTQEGIYKYDMPQICGASGTTAKRLALARQADLTPKEKLLAGFIICIYQVAIGSHSIDEVFSMGIKGGFTNYIRGDYKSIVIDQVLNDSKLRQKINDLLSVQHDRYKCGMPCIQT